MPSDLLIERHKISALSSQTSANRNKLAQTRSRRLRRFSLQFGYKFKPELLHKHQSIFVTQQFNMARNLLDEIKSRRRRDFGSLEEDCEALDKLFTNSLILNNTAAQPKFSCQHKLIQKQKKLQNRTRRRMASRRTKKVVVKIKYTCEVSRIHVEYYAIR